MRIRTPQEAKEYIRKINLQEGQIRKINDKRTRGHSSSILKVNSKKNIVYHDPTTHSPDTDKQKNIPLQENWQKGNLERAYIRPKAQKTRLENVGNVNEKMICKNVVDKSILRHIKKQIKKSRKYNFLQ